MFLWLKQVNTFEKLSITYNSMLIWFKLLTIINSTLFLQQAPNPPIADKVKAIIPMIITSIAIASSKSPIVKPGPIPISFISGKTLSFTVSLFSRNIPPAIIKPSPSIWKWEHVPNVLKCKISESSSNNAFKTQCYGSQYCLVTECFFLRLFSYDYLVLSIEKMHHLFHTFQTYRLLEILDRSVIYNCQCVLEKQRKRSSFGIIWLFKVFDGNLSLNSSIMASLFFLKTFQILFLLFS